jgi:transketolase
LEQIRNDLCYHNANVKIVAVGGGFAYGALGMTHHATEDLAVLRALPRMTVVAPGDPLEAAAATRAVACKPGPCYLRLGRAGENLVHSAPVEFEIGRAIMVRDGSDLTLISVGGMLETAVAVAATLASEGLRARVLSMHTLKPLDEAAILRAAAETGAIFTLEEHSVIGGLGSATAEILAESGMAVQFKRIGLPSAFASRIGSQEYLRAAAGLSHNGILDVIRSVLQVANGQSRRW